MGDPANPHRGEAVLMMGGQPLVLRPTFGSLVAAEEELGPLFALVERASAGALRLTEMVALFWHCLHDRNGLERADFAEAVAREGLAACTPAWRTLIVQVLKGSG